jgi:hypothetical protein
VAITVVAGAHPGALVAPGCAPGCHQIARFLHRQCAICIEDSYPAGGIKPEDVALCATEGAVRVALRARAEKYAWVDTYRTALALPTDEICSAISEIRSMRFLTEG